MTEKFTGIITAIVTPFKEDGEVDIQTMGKLIEKQITARVSGIAVCATTGEGSSLSLEERKEIISYCVKNFGKKIKIIAGTGTNSISATLTQTKMAQELGCDAALIVTPYYNKPTQEGLKKYFKEVLEKTSIPVILYNVPSRTGVDLSPETIGEIASHPRCVGIKEATGNMTKALEIRKFTAECFSLLSGDDFTFFPFLACGGDGIISTTSNVEPGGMVKIYDLWKSGDIQLAREHQTHMLPLIKAMFIETNPGPVKYALSTLGLIKPVIRPPLVLPDERERHTLQIVKTLRNYMLIVDY